MACRRGHHAQPGARGGAGAPSSLDEANPPLARLSSSRAIERTTVAELAHDGDRVRLGEEARRLVARGGATSARLADVDRARRLLGEGGDALRSMPPPLLERVRCLPDRRTRSRASHFSDVRGRASWRASPTGGLSEVPRHAPDRRTSYAEPVTLCHNEARSDAAEPRRTNACSRHDRRGRARAGGRVRAARGLLRERRRGVLRSASRRTRSSS